MSRNWLITGKPGVGKTTIIERLHESLEEAGYAVGGVIAPEIRVEGERTGFHVIDLSSGNRAHLADANRTEGPEVGTYRVSLEAIERIVPAALGDARAEADIVLIDEIGPMQVAANVFVEEIDRTLDADVPTVATVQLDTDTEPMKTVMDRPDVERIMVTVENRDSVPHRLFDELDAILD